MGAKKQKKRKLSEASLSSLTKEQKDPLPQTSKLQQVKKSLAVGRTNLPVYKFKQEICRLLQEKDVLLVVAETGSGKSTQIPAYLDECGFFRPHKKKPHRNNSTDHKIPYAQSICVTQPRRVAAITVAKRVAEEMGCAPGTAVGYKVRFDDTTDLQGKHSTRIIYATDGMLLREATSDPLLSRYSVIVLDESHERSLQTDVLFGVVKRAMDARQLASRLASSADEDDDQKLFEDMTMDEKIRSKMRERAMEWRLPPLKVVV